jgi:cold-inducible RNA-binding protein
VTNIFVGNLSFATTQDDLMSVFSQYGAVDRVNIITDRDTGQARGFAFVEMPNSNEAQSAIAALNGTDLHGRSLNVNEARRISSGAAVAATDVAASSQIYSRSCQWAVALPADDAAGREYWLSHSITVAYQNWLFCGFKIQWPSSGNCTSFEGTFICCSAVKSCWLCPTGTR